MRSTSLALAPWPATLALNVLQPLQQPADIHHYAGAVARQHAMDLRH